MLHGRQTAPGRVEGGVEVRLLEQRTLGAEPAAFGRTLPLRADPQRSRFWLQRVPPGTGCAELRAAVRAASG